MAPQALRACAIKAGHRHPFGTSPFKLALIGLDSIGIGVVPERR